MKKEKYLETERLILRKIESNDYKAIFDNWASDPEVAKYVTWDAHKDYEETKKIVSKWVDNYNNPDTFCFIVCLKETKVPIGMIEVVSKNKQFKRAEIGYCYGRKWWGNGYATEALRFLIDYVNKSGFDYIYAKHTKSNPASGKVMQKANMSYAGTLKNYNLLKNGKREDIIVYYFFKN